MYLCSPVVMSAKMATADSDSVFHIPSWVKGHATKTKDHQIVQMSCGADQRYIFVLLSSYFTVKQEVGS